MQALHHRLSWSEKIVGAARFSLARLAGHPTLVNLEITRRCNATCDFCHYWTLRQESRLSDYVPVIRRLKPTVVMFTGGEPLLRHDLEGIIRGVREAFPIVYLGLVTNGALLTVDRGIAIWNSGLDQMSVSLDYMDGRHDRARGIPGLTRRILETLPRLVSEGIDNLMLNTVIKSDNLDEIPRIIEWAGSHGVKVALSCYTPVKNGNRCHLVAREQSRRLHQLIDELVRLRRVNGTIASSTYYLQHIPGYFENGGIGGCMSGRRFLTVGPGGAIHRCSEVPAECSWDQWRTGRFRSTDCRSCWVSCRGESQAPVTWERIRQVAALYSA